jgi:hypothetical protein
VVLAVQCDQLNDLSGFTEVRVLQNGCAAQRANTASHRLVEVRDAFVRAPVRSESKRVPETPWLNPPKAGIVTLRYPDYKKASKNQMLG